MDYHLHLNTDTVMQCHPDAPLCMAPKESVRAALQEMKERNHAAVLVCQDGVLVGIFTERDAMKLMAAAANFDVPLEQIMTRLPVALPASASVAAAIEKMAHGGYRRLPVVDAQGRPTGILKVESLLHYLVEHFPAMIHNLPPKPHYVIQDREGA